MKLSKKYTIKFYHFYYIFIFWKNRNWIFTIKKLCKWRILKFISSKNNFSLKKIYYILYIIYSIYIYILYYNRLVYFVIKNFFRKLNFLKNKVLNEKMLFFSSELFFEYIELLHLPLYHDLGNILYMHYTQYFYLIIIIFSKFNMHIYMLTISITNIFIAKNCIDIISFRNKKKKKKSRLILHREA